uniref:(California timema) hypothetical protein n=1 Tax=Timema californicum TaxID=61474 RepID=A0A7R9JJ06_TIMCA|nr:unnamed protein product [Timema californicum]
MKVILSPPEAAVAAVCPPLDTPPHGYLLCHRQLIRAARRGRRRVVNHAGTVCELKCPHGSRLRGVYRKTCHKGGYWVGPEVGYCLPSPHWSLNNFIPLLRPLRYLRGWIPYYNLPKNYRNYIHVSYGKQCTCYQGLRLIACLSVCLSACLYVCLPSCLSAFLPVCLPCLTSCLTVSCTIYRPTLELSVPEFKKPTIECPANITTDLLPEERTTFVAFTQPVTDINWFRHVVAEPMWGKLLEAELPEGVWPVRFTARHPISHLSASCTLVISVLGRHTWRDV